jgi:uncharacterized membrane protein/Mg-chelatase subunit ChlD
MKRFLLMLFPRPRRPVTWVSAIPLAAAVLVIAAVVLTLELRSIVMFSEPGGFLALLVLPWIWWLHVTGFSGLSGVRKHLALQCRFAVTALFAMMLAQPRAVRESNVLSVIYALDVSDSVGEAAADAALEYVIRTATEKPERDEAGLVLLGRDAGIELPCRQTFPFEAINCQITRDGTNLEQGLSLAAALLPDENQGRIVLISDGAETEGSVERILDQLQARDVAVDVLPIEYQFAEEVWLDRLELPKSVKVGETYEASVILTSLKPGNGTLVLRENGEEICREPVSFGAGKTRFSLPLYLRQPGYYEYVATIEVPPGRDGWEENNIAINYLYLKGEGKVLLVTDPAGDPRDWQQLAGAMTASELAVETCTSYEFPQDALSLLPYDSIVFANVPADGFDATQLEAVRDAVYTQGTGFLMVGGKNSFGPGGYHRSAVEQALPVDMDIKQRKMLPKGALAIILHTCEFPEGNTCGKRIAKEAIRVLGDEDEVGCLAFDWQGADSWIFPLTPAGEYEKLVKLINKAQIGDMPGFGPTMKLAQDALEASDAATRHMIIISDGDPSPPAPGLLQQFISSKISVSTVAINPHGGQDTALMQSIAATTGGRYYFPQDPALLPQIFIKEAKTLRRSLLQNKDYVPVVDFPSAILKGIEALPELHGLVLTTPKPRATTILKVPSQEDLDPVLATWRYGLGKSAAFTSDLSPNWGRDWVQWERFRAFVRQLMIDISRVDQDTSLRMTSFASGGDGVIVVDDYRKGDSFLDLQAQIAGPRGRQQSVALRQTGPRRYEGRFELWGQGRYRVVAAGGEGERNEQVFGGFVIPYSPEYLRFRSNPVLLNRIADATGGRLLSGTETGAQLFTPEREIRSSSRLIAHLFLILLACLIPLDVALRRIQLDWAVVRRWFGLGRRAESEQTFRTLLQRKKSIDFGGREPQPRPQPPETGPSRLPGERTAPAAVTPKTGRRPKPAPDSPDKKAGDAAETPTTTTGRLLAKKRRWKQEDES